MELDYSIHGFLSDCQSIARHPFSVTGPIRQPNFERQFIEQCIETVIQKVVGEYQHRDFSDPVTSRELSLDWLPRCLVQLQQTTDCGSRQRLASTWTAAGIDSFVRSLMKSFPVRDVPDPVVGQFVD